MIDGDIFVVPQIEEVIEPAKLVHLIIRNINHMTILSIVQDGHIRERHDSRGILRSDVTSSVNVLKCSRAWHCRDYCVTPESGTVGKENRHHISVSKTVEARRRYGSSL